MIMSSGSLLLHLDYAEGNWYYPLLRENVDFVRVPTIESLPGIVEHCEKNVADCKRIVSNANAFVDHFCTTRAAALYIKHLFEALAR